jgi:hypothetical protein
VQLDAKKKTSSDASLIYCRQLKPFGIDFVSGRQQQAAGNTSAAVRILIRIVQI